MKRNICPSSNQWSVCFCHENLCYNNKTRLSLFINIIDWLNLQGKELGGSLMDRVFSNVSEPKYFGLIYLGPDCARQWLEVRKKIFF